MTSTGWAGVIIAILIVVGLGWYFATSQQTATPPADTNIVIDNTATTTDTTANPSTSGTDAGMPDTGTTGTGVSAGAGASVGTVKTVTVTYTASGFSPKSVTINKGDTVKFVDQGGGSMWVASAQHPDHVVYDGTDRAAHCAAGYTGPKPFDECGTGSSYSFTFAKSGSFNYHNHAASQFFGTVVVK